MKTIIRHMEITGMLAAAFLLAAAGTASAGLKIGEKFPAVSGRNLMGDALSVAELTRNQASLVAFWSIYCKPCVAEISSLIKVKEQYQGSIAVVGINIDGELPPARIRAFVDRYQQFEKKNLNYPVIFDEGNKISKQLGVGFLPTVIALDGQGVITGIFVGFDEKNEADILAGIERMLPGTPPADTGEASVFEAEVLLPVCGFYDETGWKESFDGNKDLDKELDKAAALAREMVLKKAMDKALEKLGVKLCENDGPSECFKPFGVFLLENPWKELDCLTNLLNALSFRKYSRVLETEERFLGKEFFVRQKVAVDLDKLKTDLERINFSLTPMSISFVVVNMNDRERAIIEQAILSQSKYIGRTDFPAYTVYTNQDAFIDELKKLDYGRRKVFIDDAGSGMVEVELWR